ncbi:sensor histidine kinase [Paenibacillus apiarius]|uniref:sensor histidine kinase n=1 Tax=Paenibacillus apiarius TaxID=46240 RepID=UPI00197E01F4|nr:HAMP domain-containing sensor histidine kinase [Paenibacillus apiarius]MBN3526849.1 HAMP domain-containing histidine kinase [Paenibacillus apiarius]
MIRLSKSGGRRRQLFGSLRWQLLSRSLLILAVLLVLIGLFQYVFMRQFTYHNKAESLRNQALSIPPEAWRQAGVPVQNNGYRSGWKAVRVRSQDGGPPPVVFMPGVTIAFIDKNGAYSVLSEWKSAGAAPRLPDETYNSVLQSNPALRRDGTEYEVVSNADGEEQIVVLHPIQLSGSVKGIVQISARTGPMKEELGRQLLIFIVLAIFALLAGLLTFLPVLKRTLHPLSNMVHAVENVNAGNLDERFSTNQGQQEIDRLAISFNRMLERLRASFEAEKEAKEQMRQFVADASHELRTPLTSIHGFLEVLLRGASQQPEQLEKALHSMYGESERLNHLVRDLLLLAKLDRTPDIALSEGRLDKLIQDMEPQLRLLAGSRHVELELSDPAVCRFDSDKMKQVILNLFYNAVQHTEPDTGIITLELKRTSDAVQLMVKDNGIGIDAKHISYVFDRFYRKDYSRTRKNGGAGLGLSISKSIVESHGGTIHVESQAGKGAAFMIVLPITSR